MFESAQHFVILLWNSIKVGSTIEKHNQVCHSILWKIEKSILSYELTIVLQKVYTKEKIY